MSSALSIHYSHLKCLDVFNCEKVTHKRGHIFVGCVGKIKAMEKGLNVNMVDLNAERHYCFQQ